MAYQSKGYLGLTYALLGIKTNKASSLGEAGSFIESEALAVINTG